MWRATATAVQRIATILRTKIAKSTRMEPCREYHSSLRGFTQPAQVCAASPFYRQDQKLRDIVRMHLVEPRFDGRKLFYIAFDDQHDLQRFFHSALPAVDGSYVFDKVHTGGQTLFNQGAGNTLRLFPGRCCT